MVPVSLHKINLTIFSCFTIKCFNKTWHLEHDPATQYTRGERVNNIQNNIHHLSEKCLYVNNLFTYI